MKVLILIISILFSIPVLFLGQEVTNIHFEQVGKQIHIFYDLQGDQCYTVQVFYSTDNDHSWGEQLKHVTGAVGEDQKPENNKLIIWDVLKETNELFGDIRFKIVAEPVVEKSEPNDLSGKSGTFIDNRDGQEYKWVQIGEQVWMAENINIGRMILKKSDQTDNDKIEKYCYDDERINCNKSGGLYEFNEAINYYITNDDQGICPKGWHLPSHVEWDELAKEVSRKFEGNTTNKNQDDNIGFILKATHGWKGGKNGSDELGFAALPGGRRDSQPKTFDYGTSCAYFWTSTPKKKKDGVCISIRGTELRDGVLPKKEGISVRCVKD